MSARGLLWVHLVWRWGLTHLLHRALLISRLGMHQVMKLKWSQKGRPPSPLNLGGSAALWTPTDAPGCWVWKSCKRLYPGCIATRLWALPGGLSAWTQIPKDRISPESILPKRRAEWEMRSTAWLVKLCRSPAGARETQVRKSLGSQQLYCSHSRSSPPLCLDL